MLRNFSNKLFYNFRNKPIFRNTVILISGCCIDIGINVGINHLYINHDLYDEKLDNKLFKKQNKAYEDYFKDDKLFRLFQVVELPISSYIEEFGFRDCLMKYAFMHRMGMPSKVACIFQSIVFAIMHEPATLKKQKNINKHSNYYEKEQLYLITYYSSIFCSGLVFGSCALLTKTLWVPTLVHLIGNEICAINNRQKYNELTTKTK